MAWFWLNVPLGALIFLAVAGIPMWLVIKRPDTGPGSAAERRAAYRRSPRTAFAASGYAPAGPQRGRTRARRASREQSGRNELAGAASHQ